MVGKVRIPKRIGALKVPRKIRKKANRAIKAATGPLVRDFATAAVAAAARTRANERGPRAGGSLRTETVVEIDGDRIGEAFRSAAILGFRRFLEGFEEGLRKVQAEKDDPQPEPRASPDAPAKAKAPAKSKAPAKPKPKPPAGPKPRRRASGSAAPRAPGAPSA